MVYSVNSTTVSHHIYRFQNYLESFNSPTGFLPLTIQFDFNPDSFVGMNVWIQERILDVGMDHPFV